MSARARQADRSSEIDRIVGEVIRQRSSGVRVDESALQERHTHLMPELGHRLRMLEMIETAGRHAREHPRTAASEPDTEAALDEGFGFLQDALADYELLERIHYGGQGIVYKAAQRSTNRIVAVKVLLHGPLATDRQRHRFAREVDLISRLRHPNIVTLYDSGEVRGHLYFAMEFIDGLPIDDYVLVRGLTVRETIGLFTTICRAVNSAHQYGIIHRDLKPSNVLVDADGRPHVLDFGLAKDLIPPDSSGDVSFMSLPGQVVGTYTGSLITGWYGRLLAGGGALRTADRDAALPGERRSRGGAEEHPVARASVDANRPVEGGVQHAATCPGHRWRPGGHRPQGPGKGDGASLPVGGRTGR